jgi:hypothetical protein
MNKNIIVTIFLIFINFCFSQTTLEGKVYDSNTKKPLESVSIYIENTHYGTVTNSEGKYKFTFKAENTTIAFSYLGYETREINSSEIPNKLFLSEHKNILEEVLITNNSVSSILKEVLKSTKKALKKPLLQKTYNRELSKINGEYNYFADGIVEYHIRNNGKKIKSDTYLKQSRTLTSASKNASEVIESIPIKYDVKDQIKEGFGDYELLKHLYKREDRYDFVLKTKTYNDSLTHNIIEFKPKDTVINDNYDGKHLSGNFLFKGKVVYDSPSKLILDMDLKKASNSDSDALYMKNFILTFKYFDVRQKASYRIDGDKYILVYKKEYHKLHLYKALGKEYDTEYEFYTSLNTLSYKEFNGKLDRNKRYKNTTIYKNGNQHTNDFWDNNSILSTEEEENFINSIKQ